LVNAFAVLVESNDRAKYFQGLFVQARALQSESYNTGTFDVIGDSQLEVLTCGTRTVNVSISRFPLTGAFIPIPDPVITALPQTP